MSLRSFMIGAFAGAALVAVLAVGVLLGFELGRGRTDSAHASPSASPSSFPSKGLIVASPASLLPDTSDFPGKYVAIGQGVGGDTGTPGAFETLRGINGNQLSASVSIDIYPTVAGAQARYREVIASAGEQPPLALARRYGDEAQLYGQPLTSSVSQQILHLRDRNGVADVTIYDNSGTVSSQAMTTALYAITDLFSARIAAA